MEIEYCSAWRLTKEKKNDFYTPQTQLTSWGTGLKSQQLRPLESETLTEPTNSMTMRKYHLVNRGSTRR
jgi:hypothetical protein